MHPARVFQIVSTLKAVSMGAHAVIYAPFLLNLHMSLGDIALLNAAYNASIFLLEIPTGMLADGKSRAWSVNIGVATLAVAIFIYTCATGFWTALAAEVTVGVGHAFISGAFDAWLVDSLKNRNEFNDRAFKHFLAETNAYEALGAVLACVAGSWIGVTFGVRWAWAFGGVFMVVAWFICKNYMNGDGGEAPINERVSEIEAFRLTMHGLRNQSTLRWGAAATTTFGLVMPFNHYWSPYFVNRIGQMNTAFIWIPLYLSLALTSYAVKMNHHRFASNKQGVMLSMFFAGAGLALIGAWTSVWPAIAFGIVHEFGRGLYRPFSSALFQTEFKSANRATAGSVQSFIQTMGWTLILLVISHVLRDAHNDPSAIVATWIFCGTLLASSSLIFWAWQCRNN